ncbi:MAG: type II toxin-antitoxin system PemK/MazF family toxin [Actinomycetes bacterium]
MTDLIPADVVWVAPDPTVGREQAGRRPAVVVSGNDYLNTVETLAIVLAVTSVDLAWPNHVPLSDVGLPQHSWAMTEQVHTISRTRIVDRAGRVDASTLQELRRWIRDFLDL